MPLPMEKPRQKKGSMAFIKMEMGSYGLNMKWTNLLCFLGRLRITRILIKSKLWQKSDKLIAIEVSKRFRIFTMPH